MTIHTQIRARIRKLGIRPVARLSGVPVTTVRRYLMRDGDATYAVVEALAKATGFRIIVQNNNGLCDLCGKPMAGYRPGGINACQTCNAEIEKEPE